MTAVGGVRANAKESIMFKDEDVPVEGMKADEWLCGYRAKVWWQREVMLAFPSATDRGPILDALEKTMGSYGTATLFYHLEKVGPHFLQMETAETDDIIYVNVRIGEPIIVAEANAFPVVPSGLEG